jgi:hypothetical protein
MHVVVCALTSIGSTAASASLIILPLNLVVFRCSLACFVAWDRECVSCDSCPCTVSNMHFFLGVFRVLDWWAS